MLTVLKLKVGDRVREPGGVSGTVSGFRRDWVLIAWDDEASRSWHYSDEDLRQFGIVRASHFEAEDTVPG